MIHKKKRTILTLILVIFALIYVLSFVFDSGRIHSRPFAWLDSSHLNLANRVEIHGLWGRTILNRRNNVWFLLHESEEHWQELPVKQARVEELFTSLCGKYPHVLHANSFEGRSRLGVSDDQASRIIVYGGACLPLLDLFVGGAALLDRNVYTRLSGRNEIYSGEDRLTLFTDSGPAFWYDLRLFPQLLGSQERVFFGTAAHTHLGGGASQVQQAEVKLPGSDDRYALLRLGAGWIITGEEGGTPDANGIEAWLGSLLEAEAVDFAFSPPASVEGSISLWFGDGTDMSIQVSPPDGENLRSAIVSGTNLVYILPEWTFERLFRERDYFIRSDF